MTELTVVVPGEVVGDIEFGDIRKAVQDARTRAEESYWDLSVLLHDVHQNSYYVSWGHASWVDYIEMELDMQRRKAQYLVSIQDWFGRMPPHIQQWVRGLGWTKAKELVGIVDEDNADEWRDRLDGLSFRDMMDVLKGKNGVDVIEEIAGDATVEVDDKPISMKFKLFPDQHGNVTRALERARDMAESEKDGHALDLICTDFLSTNGGIDSLADYLAKIEKAVGIRIIGFDPNEDAIVYGADTLDSLVDEEI